MSLWHSSYKALTLVLLILLKLILLQDITGYRAKNSISMNRYTSRRKETRIMKEADNFASEKLNEEERNLIEMSENLQVNVNIPNLKLPALRSSASNASINIFNTKNLAFVVLASFLGSIVIGMIYYSSRHGWDFPTSFFYAVQVLLGAMIGVPSETQFYDRAFTLVYYIWGSTLIAGAVGSLAASIVEQTLKLSRKQAKRALKKPSALTATSLIPFEENADYRKYGILIATGVWVAVGIFYSLAIEKFNLEEAVYYSFGTMSAAGSPAPGCISGENATCHLGWVRGIFNGIYLMIGVPLFGLCLGQFSGFIVEKAVHANELMKMRSPLSTEEYEFAANLNSLPNYQKNKSETNEKIDLAEFIVMELLRLKRVEIEEIEEIKEIFHTIDSNNDGMIDRAELLKNHLLYHDDESVPG